MSLYTNRLASLGCYLQRTLHHPWSRAVQGVQPPTLDHPCRCVQQHHVPSTSSHSVTGNDWYLEPLGVIWRGYVRSSVTCPLLLPCLGIGPSELKGDNEDGPDDNKKPNDNGAQIDGAPRQRYRDDPEAQDSEPEDDNDDDEDDAPETSLLPRMVRKGLHKTNKHVHSGVNYSMDKLPSPIQTAITAVYNFMTPPLIGAIIGAILGLTPPLHTLFFADSNKGGYFNAWLMQSIKNVGQLFVTLQVVVVGVKLAQALRKEKRGEDTGKLNWTPILIMTVVRYFIWPA
jgi:hypothetical protein